MVAHNTLYLILSAITFVISTISIIAPKSFKIIIPSFLKPIIKTKKEFFNFHFDLEHVPILLVIIGLIFGNVTLTDVKRGIIGSPDTGLEPYAILILFFGTAYLCLSLGESGLFRFLAKKFAIWGGTKGKVLFQSFFILSSLLTVATSNDIVILNLTPIICSICLVSNVDVKAFALPAFFVSNIFSMILVVGNPTNVIAASSYELNFAEYSKWTILPAFASAITCYLMSYWYFADVINNSVLDANLALKLEGALDIFQATFGVINLGICIIIIIIHQFFDMPLWLSITPFVILEIIFDIFIAIKHDKRNTMLERNNNKQLLDINNTSGSSSNNNNDINNKNIHTTSLMQDHEQQNQENFQENLNLNHSTVVMTSIIPNSTATTTSIVSNTWKDKVKRSKPWIVCKQLPWVLLILFIYVFKYFIFVFINNLNRELLFSHQQCLLWLNHFQL